jgi:hypothetical protein
VPNSERYRFLSSNGEHDFSRVVCEDCSTRTRAVVIPADERDEHDVYHRADRHARIENMGHTDLERVRRYLPANYIADSDGGSIFIHGYDNAGWTLDGYVIPRLASGLIRAEEI